VVFNDQDFQSQSGGICSHVEFSYERD